MGKKEIKFLIKWTFFLLFLTSLPYFSALFRQTPDFRYTGYSTINSADINTYLAWAYQAKKGFYLFEDKYTTEEHQRFFFHPLFFLIGKFSSIFNLNLIVSFHIFRIIFNLIFIFSLYIFISYFQKDSKLRKYTFIFTTISSGFGGYLIACGIINEEVFSQTENLPVDIWLPEAIPIFSMYGINLFPISISLILLIYLFYLKSINEENYKFSFISGIFLCGLLFIHPYHLLSVVPALTIWSLYLLIFRKKRILSFLIILFFTLLPFIYIMYFFYVNPVFKNWAEQPRYSPSIYNYFLGFGISFIFFPIALKRVFKKGEEKELFLVFLVLINLLLLYFPVSFQRRIVEGLYIPLSVISFPIIFEFAEFLSFKINKDKMKILRIIIILSTFSNICVLISEIKVLSRVEFPYYLPKELLNTFKFIEKNIPPNSIFLASYPISNFLPAQTGIKVYAGHYDQTLFFDYKKEKAKRFWEREKDCRWKSLFLKENKIDYLLTEEEDFVFYSPGEYVKNRFIPPRRGGAGFTNSCHFFRIIYNNKKYKIWEKVNP